MWTMRCESVTGSAEGVGHKTSVWLPLVVTPSLAALLKHQPGKWDMSCSPSATCPHTSRGTHGYRAGPAATDGTQNHSCTPHTVFVQTGDYWG